MIHNRFQVGSVWRPKRGKQELQPVVITQVAVGDKLVTIGTDRAALRNQQGEFVSYDYLRSRFVFVGQVTAWPPTMTQGEAIDEVMDAHLFALQARRAA